MLILKSNNVDLDAIIDRYGTNYGEYIRATDYGGQNIEQATINLVVSRGDRNRVHRESLFSPSYKLIKEEMEFISCFIIVQLFSLVQNLKYGF